MSWKLFRRRRILTLDGPPAPAERFERVQVDENQRANEKCSAYDHEDTYFWLEELLKWSLAVGATTIELLRDDDDHCLRQLVYRPPDSAAGYWSWFECIPMVPSFAEHGIRDLRVLARLSARSTSGSIKYEHLGATKEAVVTQVDGNTYMIYLSADRPDPVFKGDTLSTRED